MPKSGEQSRESQERRVQISEHDDDDKDDGGYNGYDGCLKQDFKLGDERHILANVFFCSSA